MDDDFQQQILANTKKTSDEIVSDNPTFDAMAKQYSPSGGEDQAFDQMVSKESAPDNMEMAKAVGIPFYVLAKAVKTQLSDVPAQMLGGFWDSVRNMSGLVVDAVGGVLTPVEKALGASGEKAKENLTDPRKLPTIPESKQPVAQMSRSVAQFLFPFAIAKTGLAGMATTKLGALLTSGAEMGFAGFTGFQGNEGRLVDMLKEMGVKNPVTDYLSTDKNDGEIEARFKTALESAGLGVAADGLVGTLRWAKQAWLARTAFKSAADETSVLLKQGKDQIKAVGRITDVAPDKGGNLGPVPMNASEPTKSATKKAVSASLKQTENLEGLTGNPFQNEEVAKAAYRKSPEWMDFHQQIQDAHLDSLTREQVLSGEAAQQLRESGQTSKLFRATQLQADMAVNQTRPAIDTAMKRIAAGDLSAWDDAGNAVIDYLDMDNEVKNLFRPSAQASAERSMSKDVQLANQLRQALSRADQMTKEKMTKVLVQTFLDNPADISTLAEKAKIKISAGKKLEKVLQEIYVNGLLSNPLGTGFKDVASTFVFNGVMVPGSKFFAGMLTPLRRAIWKQASEGMDQVYAREAAVYLQSYLESSLDAVRWIGKVLKQETSESVTNLAWGSAKNAIQAYEKGGIQAAEKAPLAEGRRWQEILDGFASLRDKTQTRFDSPRGVRAISAESFGVERETKLGRTLDMVGNMVSAPSSGMMGKDDLIKSGLYRAEIKTRAIRRALTEGLEGDAYHQRVQQICDVGLSDINWEDASMAKNTLLKMGVALEKESDFQVYKGIVDRSIAQARVDTFTNQLGPKGEAVAKFIQNIPYGWTVVPFQKTPGNILHQTFVYSPVAPLLADVRQQIAAGGAEADMALGRIAMGSTMMTAAWALAYNGLITGKLPANRTEANQLQSIGFMSNSAKVGDMYYSLQGFEPASTILTAPATILQIARDAHTPFSAKDEAAAQDALTLSIMGTAEMLMDKTYTMGLMRLLSAITENTPKPFQKIGRDTLASFMPYSAAIRAITTRINPYVQEIDSITDKLRADYWDGSRPKLDPFGEPIARHPTLLGMEPYSDIENSRSAKIMVEALRVGAQIKQPDRVVEGVELNPDQYQKLMGTIKASRPVDQLERIMARGSYINAPETYSRMGNTEWTKAGMLQTAYSAIVKDAENKLIKSDSDLAQRIKVNKMERDTTQKMSPTSKLILQSQGRVPTFSPR